MTFKVKDGISIAGSGFVDGSRNVTANNTTLTGELRGPATFVIDPAAVGDNTGTVVIKGDLQIEGTTTTVNSTTLTVDDKNIELGSVASPTDTTADGGGITLRGDTDKTFTWVNATDAWTSSEHIAIAAGKDLIINGQSSGVINLKAPVLAGTQSIYLPPASGTIALTSDIKDTSITVTAGGGLTGGGSFTLNQSSVAAVTLSHADTSSAANLTATSRTYVTGLTFDTYGHVTGYTTGTETVTDTNTITRLRGTTSGTYTSGDLTLLAGTGIGVSQSGTDFTISNSGVTSIVAGNAITISGATGAVTVNHSDTSSVANVTAATNTFVSGITFDTYGHVQSITTGAPSGFLTGNQTITLSGDTTGSGTTSIATTTNYMSTSDDRTKAPSDDGAGKLRFGFTSWANNNTSPYADYLHLRSYTDSSGGSDNLLMFRKDAIGLRLWQQTFGSGTAYSTYKDVAFTDQIPTVNNATLTLAVSGNGLSGSQTFTANQATAATFTVTSNATNANTANTIVFRDGSGNFSAGTITASLNGNASSATTASTSNSVASIGYGSGNYTWYQSSGNWQTWTGGWASHLVSNHGDGSTYYNQILIMPFWGAPQYMRKEGGTNKGPYTFITTENQASYAPSLTGTGASGTWGISISGSAATVSSIGATQVTNLYSPNGASVVSGDATTALPSTANSLIHTLGTGPSGNDGHILGMTWTSPSTYGAQIWLDTDPTSRMAVRSRSSAGVWNSWAEVITNLNIASYASVPTFQTLNIDSNGNLDYNKYDINSTATINIKNMPLNFTGSGTLSISSYDLILTL
jgi:hypothetical protein